MKTILLPFLLLFGTISYAQVDTNSDLYQELAKLDSLIFEESFNRCHHEHLDVLISTSFEFYHDQGGLTNNKADFIQSIKNNICSNPKAKPIRELTAGTLQVFPMYDQGSLYAAIQSGEHAFYIAEPDKVPYLTSTAKFTHLWVKEGDEWMLRSVLSYDHQAPEH